MSSDPAERMVLRRLRDGPAWIRSLGLFKYAANRLVDRGLVERVRPLGRRARNMMALTDTGRAELERQA